MVQKINDAPWIKFVIWAVYGVEGPFDIVVVRVSEVGYINISMLEPTRGVRIFGGTCDWL